MRSKQLAKKYSGVVGIGMFVILVTLIVFPSFRSFSYTISNSTSQSLMATVSFAVFGCIASLLVGYSLLFYIPGKWKLGWVYRIIAGLIGLAFFITCLFPNDPNTYSTHDYASWAMAAFSYVLVTFLMFRLWKHYGVRLRVVNMLAFLVMSGVVVLIIATYGFFRSIVLIFEEWVCIVVFCTDTISDF